MPEKICPLLTHAIMNRTSTLLDGEYDVQTIRDIMLCKKEQCEFWLNDIEHCIIHKLIKEE
jgi:hypothetical protein